MSDGFIYLDAKLEADLLTRRREWYALVNHLILLIQSRAGNSKIFAQFEPTSERLIVRATVGQASVSLVGDHVEFHNIIGPQIDKIVDGPERLILGFAMRGWQVDERKRLNIEDYFERFVAQFVIDSENMLTAKLAEIQLEDALNNCE